MTKPQSSPNPTTPQRASLVLGRHRAVGKETMMCDSGVDETKVRVFKYRPIGESQWCIADSFDAVKDELDLCNDDDGIEVMPVTMTRHQLDNLPEFTGW
jgi:hypothetical protein